MSARKISFIEASSPGLHIFSKFPIPRLGAVLLSTILRERGYTVKTFIEDLATPDWSFIESSDIVCISTITSTAIKAYSMGKRLRALNIPVIMGGAHPTFLPDEALDQFLVSAKAADPLRFPDLSLSVVKLMGAGEYAVELPGGRVAGHFGLAVKDYTHSTAPNRRYPDLITQRLLKAAMAGRSLPYENDELEALAKHCTEEEDAAKKVERLVSKSAATMLLESRIGEHFDAIVTGAADKGTWVRLLHTPIEGRLESGFEGMDVGHRLRVQLVRTDVDRGYIDFKRVV